MKSQTGGKKTKAKVKPKTKPKAKTGAKPKISGKDRYRYRGIGDTDIVKSKPVQLNTHPKADNNNLMITTLAIGAAGVLGFLGLDLYHKRKQVHAQKGNTHTPTSDSTSTSSGSNADDTTKKKTSHGSETGTDTSTGGFPLKRGSKGESVRKVQQALLDKYGSDILPKYGADGDFGSEVARALKKLGFHSTISRSEYNVIIQGGDATGGSGGDDAKSGIAQNIYLGIQDGNFDNVLSSLKQIVNKEDYSQVSTAFKDNYRIGGVHQTLVNGTLDSFLDEGQKQQIRYEFLRMGLQYDGTKWSLSGIEGFTIITRYPTTVWVNSVEKTNVPANMVLGTEVATKLDYTLFENNNRFFLVQTAAIKRIN